MDILDAQRHPGAPPIRAVAKAPVQTRLAGSKTGIHKRCAVRKHPQSAEDRSSIPRPKSHEFRSISDAIGAYPQARTGLNRTQVREAQNDQLSIYVDQSNLQNACFPQDLQ